MDPFGDVRFDDRAVVLPDEEVLLVADLHVGRDAASDVELPLGEAEDLVSRFDALLTTHEPEQVIVAGDLLHSFRSIPYGVPDTIERIRETVANRGGTMTVLTGNHDSLLEDITDLDTRSVIDIGGTVVHHGHEVPDSSGERYVIGHEHPAIVVEGDRYPCFLDCRNQLDGHPVLVLPAFSRLAVGTVVNRLDASDSMSPLLTAMGECRPVLRTDDQTLRFPSLETLSAHL